MPVIPATRIRARQTAKSLRSEPTRLIALARKEATSGDVHLAFELCRAAPKAVAQMSVAHVRAFLPVLCDWVTVDCFGSFISGVAWREGVLSDTHIAAWTKSGNRWIRRAALVSTVPLNLRARGATNTRGEARKTLAVCAALLDDRDDMVVKAMSWALRELARRDPAAVRVFLSKHDARLAARAKREVNNKLRTGLKNP